MTQIDERLRATIRQLRMVANGAGADREDVVQEALARAIARDVPPDALPWLRTVVRRLAIDRARQSHETPWGDGDEVTHLGGLHDRDPEHELISKETCEEIAQALAALPPRYREALIAFAEEGQRPALVAQRLGLTPNATWTLLSRARARLRARLREVGVMPASFWARSSRWTEPATHGALAVGVAVSLALTVPAAAPALHPGPEVVEVAVAPDPEPAPALESLSLVAEEVQPEAGGVASPPAPTAAVTVPIDYGVSACTPSDEGPSVAAGLRFEDHDSGSLSGRLLDGFPLLAQEEQVVDVCPE